MYMWKSGSCRAVNGKLLKLTNRFRSSLAPRSADVVIIGGGCIGASTLYHLNKFGVTNTVLLEKNTLTSGTTWHSNGLVWRLRPSDLDIHMLKKTTEAITSIESEKNEIWIENGGMFISNNRERDMEYERLHTLGKYFGIESKILAPQEAKQLFPLLNVDDVTSALYSPGDGMLDPTGYTNLLCKTAVKNGSKVIENCSVNKILTENTWNGKRKVIGVETDKGVINTNYIVNCAGSWSQLVCDMLDLEIPLFSMHHSYVVTEGVGKNMAGLPNLRDHDLSIVFKVIGDKFQIGGYEQNPIFWNKIEKDFCFSLFEFDWNTFEEHMTNAMHRIPIIEQTGVHSCICGPESFTPDHKPLIGETEVNGFFLNCGFNSAGLMYSGGAGYEMAKLISTGSTEFDTSSLNISRFHPSLRKNKNWIKERSHESYATNYNIVFPRAQSLAGRNMVLSPFHNKLVDNNCVFEEKMGMEVPSWFNKHKEFENLEIKPYDYFGNYGYKVNDPYPYRSLIEKELTFDWPLSFSSIGKEHYNCKKNVSLFDRSDMAKFLISGPDSKRLLDFLCTSQIPIDGGVVHSLILNKNAGVECHVTIVFIEPENAQPENAQPPFFYLTTKSESAYKCRKLIDDLIIDSKLNCKVFDTSSDFGVLSLQGPKSLIFLRELVDEKLETSEYSTYKYNNIAGIKCLTMLTTDTGECGAELHIQKENCEKVFDFVIEKGADYGLQLAGYMTWNLLGFANGYNFWQGSQSNDTPLESKLLSFCKLNTSINFQGRDVLEKQIENGAEKELQCFIVDSTSPLHGNELVYKEQQIIGYTRKTQFSFSENKTLVYAYVKRGSVGDEEIANNNNLLTIETKGNFLLCQTVSFYNGNPKTSLTTKNITA